MGRATARAAVMQMIYEHLEGGEGGEETLRMVYDTLRSEGEENSSVQAEEPNDKDRSYISTVLCGVLEKMDELDDKIRNAAIGWTLERMPMIDLTVLRLATWEILYEEDVPGNVAISEALDLIEKYSDPTDKSFVNGVLGKILRDFEG